MLVVVVVIVGIVNPGKKRNPFLACRWGINETPFWLERPYAGLAWVVRVTWSCCELELFTSSPGSCVCVLRFM
jgi:hypothetical protein